MRHRGAWALFIVIIAVGDLRLAAATQVPVGGRSVGITARNPARRTLTFRSAIEAAIAAPFPDPTTGATLQVVLPNGPSQCHAVIPLPAIHWRPVASDGPGKGWRYRDGTAGAQGVRGVSITPRRGGGRIVVKVRGPFPCALPAPQTGPVSLALHVDTTRYCAEFGGTVHTNATGRFRATQAPAPSRCIGGDVTVASLNVLHGIVCPAPTVGCRRADRIALLRDAVVARGCPDVVALQEIMNLGGAAGENALAIPAALATACPAPYAVAYLQANPIDDEMILSRHPIQSATTVPLLGSFRNVLHVRIDHPVGLLDVYATHLASGGDLATGTCGVAFNQPCPPACVTAGAVTVRDCQAVQTALHVEATHDVATAALLVGDFNETPGSFVYDQFANRGWVDAYLAAGHPECIPATGVGCTSGRDDDTLTDLESPALGQSERIDFIWRVPPGPGATCPATVEPAGDSDGDGIATRLFADEPVPGCGPTPAPICWTSDHTGVQADLNCD